MGCHFYKKDGIEIGFGATELKDLETIDTEALDKRLKECTFEIACDVTNPLCGTTGASAVFAPQKGADEPMVVKLDAALAHFADVTEKALGVDNRNMPGAGAAGGLGFAFASYLGGDLRPGVEIVLDAVLPEKELSEADIVVTGEGLLWEKRRLELQSGQKKRTAWYWYLPAALNHRASGKCRMKCSL